MVPTTGAARAKRAVSRKKSRPTALHDYAALLGFVVGGVFGEFTRVVTSVIV